MKIAVIGGNGYIGRNFIDHFSKKTSHSVLSLSPNAEDTHYSSDSVTAKNCDIFDTPRVHELIKDCDIVYYLVHMMSQKKYDFAVAEERAAKSLVEAVDGTRVQRIIYLGGLGADADKLSKHLSSRHYTGEILRRSSALVIEFRASMVVGEGSISYDIITNLVHKLPVLTLPRWAKTLTQPIGLNDALLYLTQASDVSIDAHEIIEIGGPEKMSYEEFMRRYAEWNNSPVFLIHFPIIPVSVAAWWLNLFTPPKHAKVGRTMVESLANPMVVTTDRARTLFPGISPCKVEESFV